MSDYFAPAIHPLTKRIEQAHYADNYFGRHQYAVIFEDGSVWRLEQLPRWPDDPSTKEPTDG